MMKNIFFILISLVLVSCTGKMERTEFDYHVCAFVWPSCHDDSLGRTNWEQGIGEWEVIQKGDPRFEGHYQPKLPLWGYEMDNDPVVVERWIQTALEYGVNTFIYDWYWFDHYPYLESALNDGFLKAPSNQKMEFFIMWANHDVAHNYWNYHKWGEDDSLLWDGAIDPADWPIIVKRVISQYFVLPNYTKINGCPVFAMFSSQNFIESFDGDVDRALEAMNYLREEVRKAGFPDVHYMMVNGAGPKYNDESKDRVATALKLKPDSWAWYNMGGFDSDYLKHCENAVSRRELWDAEVDIPLFPTVSISWDDTPRFPKKGADKVTRFHNTPDVFARYLKQAKDYADAKADEQPKFIMINAWNEWVEGSYLLPDKLNGFSYLEAVKKVMSE
jgi:hypothetical protein